MAIKSLAEAIDVVADEQIKLVNSGTVLNQHTLKHPLIAFANYLFDSIPNDIFRVKDGELFEGKSRLTIDEEKIKHNKNLNNIALEFNNRRVGAGVIGAGGTLYFGFVLRIPLVHLNVRPEADGVGLLQLDLFQRAAPAAQVQRDPDPARRRRPPAAWAARL